MAPVRALKLLSIFPGGLRRDPGRTPPRIRKQIKPLQPVAAPSVIGIDDWAWRRNQRYGTIICDLERRRPITLLAASERRCDCGYVGMFPSRYRAASRSLSRGVHGVCVLLPAGGATGRHEKRSGWCTSSCIARVLPLLGLRRERDDAVAEPREHDGHSNCVA